MLSSAKRFKSRIKIKAYYVRCGAKTLTFLFWATLYLVAMKLTVFKSSVSPPPKDWSLELDNYTRWQLQGPILGDEPEKEDTNKIEWAEPDNATIIALEKRVENVQRVCREHSLMNQQINSREFFVDHGHNLVWCNIFKAASSSWLYKFNILGGYDAKFLARTKQIPLMLARKKFPRPSEEELRDAVSSPGVISLLIVREPFVRLLSAYRDKLENVTPPYYRKLAKAIVAEHRTKAIKILGSIKSFGPTFYEFVSYLIKKYEEDRAHTFDEHWAPYYRFCSPCAVNFTVIAKVESLANDSAYVIHQLGLGHVFSKSAGNRRTRIRTVINKSRDGRNTTALLKYYFSQLDENMLNQLLDIYGIDFEMFGYNPNVYRKYVRK